jgi:hypothetical protein
MKRFALFGLVCVVVLSVLVPRASADATVYVGYADALRPSAFFPSPWSGSSGVTFIGNATGDDAGAIRIDNTGASAITITDISVNLNGTALGDIWSTSLPVTLAPGGILIVTQTTSFNFDTSDIHQITSNTSPCLGLATDPAVCTTTMPKISVTFQGVGTTVFDDTAHVLDTGGFDFINALVCPNPLELSGNCNESLQWRTIGTTGIGNPGGNTPEPASLLFLGTGILSLCGAVRKRLQA